MKRQILNHEFVDFIPENLSEGTVYVCVPFATAVHKCCCGCGREVVTPLSPTDWSLIFDGQTISLDPSIGNWSFPCQSHYWIRRDRVQWARGWSRREIEEGRADDRLAKQRYFGAVETRKDPGEWTAERPAKAEVAESLWQKLRGLWS